MTPRMCGHDGARGTCHPLLGGKSVRRWRSATGKAVVQCAARPIHAFPATTAENPPRLADSLCLAHPRVGIHQWSPLTDCDAPTCRHRRNGCWLRRRRTSAPPVPWVGHATTSLPRRPKCQVAPRACLQSRDPDTGTRPEPLL